MSKKSKKTELKKPTSKKWILMLSILSTLLLLTAIAVAALYYTQTRTEADFVKNVYTDNLDFSQAHTFEEAQAALEEKAAYFLSTPVEFTSANGNVTLTYQSAGVTINTEQPKAELQNFMEKTSRWKKLATLLWGYHLDFPVSIDETALQAAFADSGIEQGTSDATYVLKQNTVTITPEQIGYGIDWDALKKTIQKHWEAGGMLEVNELGLRFGTPKIRSAQLEPLLPQAQLASTLTILLKDDFGNEYKLPLANHLDLLIPGSTNFFGLQQEKFITLVQTEWAIDLESEPQSVVITQAEDGSYSFDGSARFGQKVDTLALLDLIETRLQKNLLPEQLATGEDLSAPISIPITRTLPQLTVPESLKALGVNELVGVGYSDFSGSPSARIHNINEGVNQFNGLLIQQGEEFSFMEHLSPVDAEHGFLPELVIKGDETIPEYGGGMCQVSSTMFRAALYSGLPITARTNHSYAVSYYARPFGYGLDATVYDPAPDLKFINDTPGALLVQAYTEGNSAYYVFYGTNDGRRVTMDGPYSYGYNSVPSVTTYVTSLEPGVRKLKEYSHTGFKVDWTRTVTRMDGTSTTETIHSNYEARPEKWEEGVATGATVDVTE